MQSGRPVCYSLMPKHLPPQQHLPAHSPLAALSAGPTGCIPHYGSIRIPLVQSKGRSANCLMEEYLDGPEVDVDLVFSQGEPVRLNECLFSLLGCGSCCCGPGVLTGRAGAFESI